MYTPELAAEICNKTATSTKGIRKLCKENPHWPDSSTIMDWITDKPDFAPQYARAKLKQAVLLADETIEIADDARHDTITKTDKNGDEYECADNEWINRSRLRVDTRKWLAGKLAPKIYGERVIQALDVNSESTVMQKLIDKL